MSVFHLADAPDDATECLSWLERKLVGSELSELLTELAVLGGINPNAAESPTATAHPGVELTGILGSRLAAVLTNGLSALTPGQLQELMLSPHCLFDLQERVLLEGGPYWQTLLHNNSPQADPAISDRAVSDPAMSVPSPVSVERRSPREECEREAGGEESDRVGAVSRFVGRPAVVAAMILTASLLVIIGITARPSPQPTWGWMAGDALEPGSPRDYLEQLAQGGDAWFAKRPVDRDAVELRIQTLRAGCDRLVDANHAALSQEDSEWLVAKCRSWRRGLDQVLEEFADRPPMESRAAVDQIVRKLTKAIRQRVQDL